MTRPRRVVIFVVMLVVALAADQTSKAWARTLPVRPGCTVEAMAAQRCGSIPQPVIAGYWDWELAYNDGAAFSNVRGQRVLLCLIASIALVAMGIYAWRSAPEQRIRRIALGLVAGGTLGNLIDRLREGAVVDFVRWHAHEHQWPIFNLADGALVIGIALLLFENVLERRRAATMHRAPRSSDPRRGRLSGQPGRRLDDAAVFDSDGRQPDRGPSAFAHRPAPADDGDGLKFINLRGASY